MYQSCKEHDFNRNDEINSRIATKNKEDKILFNFTENWFSQSGLYIIYDYFKKDLRRFPCKWYNSRKEYLSLYLYIAVTFISIQI